MIMDRSDFAQRLNSIVIPEGISEGERNKSVLPISEALVQMMPNSLFRYRPCDENNPEQLKNNIEAFRDDKIYASTADKFNDPYDTLVRYDINSIKKLVSSLFLPDTLIQIKRYLEQGNSFPESWKQYYPSLDLDNLKTQFLGFDINAAEKYVENQKEKVLSNIDFYYPILAEKSKRFVTIACFCESVQSIAMWSHYARSHQGFALEYNFRATLKKGIENCALFPVIYDDERYDASSFMAYNFLNLMGVKILNPDAMSHIKCSLHKAKLWEYEKEWRILNYTPKTTITDVPSVIHYPPIAIYYGARMPFQIKMQLHEIAQSKKMTEYEMFIDYSSPEYEMCYRLFNG